MSVFQCQLSTGTVVRAETVLMHILIVLTAHASVMYSTTNMKAYAGKVKYSLKLLVYLCCFMCPVFDKEEAYLTVLPKEEAYLTVQSYNIYVSFMLNF